MRGRRVWPACGVGHMCERWCHHPGYPGCIGALWLTLPVSNRHSKSAELRPWWQARRCAVARRQCCADVCLGRCVVVFVCSRHPAVLSASISIGTRSVVVFGCGSAEGGGGEGALCVGKVFKPPAPLPCVAATGPSLESQGYCGAVLPRSVSCVVASRSSASLVVLNDAVCEADIVVKPIGVAPCCVHSPSACSNVSSTCRAHLCSGHGVCNKSGKPHFQLTGSNQHGTPWTKVAEP